MIMMMMMMMRESGRRAGRKRRVLSKGRGVNKSTPCSQVPGLGALLVLLNAG